MRTAPLTTPRSDRAAVLTKAAVRAADRLGLSGRHLAEDFGVSDAQVSRFRSG
jgi:hypothetical protein